MQQLHIETWGSYQRPQSLVRVKRQSDRKFYDLADKTFKSQADCTNPWVPLNGSTFSTQAEVDIDLDPKQWTDGDYTVYYHDASKTDNPLYYVDEVTIFDGDSTTRKCPYATEIAGRILDGTVASHTVPGSVGAWMADVTARLKALQLK